MPKINVEVLFPMAPDITFGERYEYPFEEKFKLINELQQLCYNTLFGLDDFFKTPFFVNIEDKIPDEYYWHFVDHGPIGKLVSTFNEKVLKFSFNTDFDYNKVKGYEVFSDKETVETSEAIVLSLLSSEIKEKIFGLILATQIAKPGSLHLRKGVILVNGKKHMDIHGTPLLRDAYSYSKKINYPPIYFLSLQDIYAWLINNDLLLKNEPTSKLQIALNAFTFLFGKDLSPEIELVYTCMALEALYTKGNSNITEQLNDKIQIYLGQIFEYQRSIRKMYDFRSKFLHGILPIKPVFDNSSIWPEHEVGIGDASYLSTMVLIATFQKMFMEDRTSLDFEYILKQG
jgi:hypothetical protein